MNVGEITGRLITGPAELVGEFDDAGNAAAARANLEIFLKWCFGAATGMKPTPAVALIVNQSKLDPEEDRLRTADWGGKAPESYVEGPLLVLDAPRSKNARDVIRKVLMNSKPKRIYDRPKKGAGGGMRLIVLVLVLVLGGAAFGVLKFLGKI